MFQNLQNEFINMAMSCLAKLDTVKLCRFVEGGNKNYIMTIEFVIYLFKYLFCFGLSYSNERRVSNLEMLGNVNCKCAEVGFSNFSFNQHIYNHYNFP